MLERSLNYQHVLALAVTLHSASKNVFCFKNRSQRIYLSQSILRATYNSTSNRSKSHSYKELELH